MKPRKCGRVCAPPRARWKHEVLLRATHPPTAWWGSQFWLPPAFSRRAGKWRYVALEMACQVDSRSCLPFSTPLPTLFGV